MLQSVVMTNALSTAAVFLAFALIATINSARAEDEGENCTHTRLGVAGVCKYLKDCPSAVNDLKEKNVNPQICGFRPTSIVPNVCCPNTLTVATPVKERDDQDLAGRTGIIAGRKCVEYSRTVRHDCAFLKPSNSTVQKLIVNGVPAKPKEFPHMALLGYGQGGSIEYSCAGSLISEQWVLTAAHCLSHPSKGSVTWVLLGDLDRSDDDDDARPQVVAVAELVRHPDFVSKLRYNDIALLRLARPATLSEYVRPACVHTGTIDVDTNVTVSGWGVTDFAEDQLSPLLLKARLSVASTAVCNESFAAASRNPGSKLPDGIRATQICAGSTKGMDACQGDSGGPLQVFTAENPFCMQHVVGVVSLGIFCGSKAPGVYSRVSAYTGWIERNVWPNERPSRRGPTPPSRWAE